MRRLYKLCPPGRSGRNDSCWRPRPGDPLDGLDRAGPPARVPWSRQSVTREHYEACSILSQVERRFWFPFDGRVPFGRPYLRTAIRLRRAGSGDPRHETSEMSLRLSPNRHRSPRGSDRRGDRRISSTSPACRIFKSEERIFGFRIGFPNWRGAVSLAPLLLPQPRGHTRGRPSIAYSGLALNTLRASGPERRESLARRRTARPL